MLGIYLLYEASSFGAMLHDQALITFARYPLTATLAWIGEFGGGLEYVFVVGFLSLVPLGFGLIIAGVIAVFVSQSRRSGGVAQTRFWASGSRGDKRGDDSTR